MALAEPPRNHENGSRRLADVGLDWCHSRVVRHPVLRLSFYRTDASDPCACRTVGAFDKDPEGEEGGRQEFMGADCYQSLAVQTSVCIEAGLSRCLVC
jgi:hypothetical protein